LIRYPEEKEKNQTPGFRLEFIPHSMRGRNDGCAGFPNAAENDKSQSDNRNIISTEGEGFQPPPIETLKRYGNQYYFMVIDLRA